MAERHCVEALRSRHAAWDEGERSIQLRWFARQLVFDRGGPVRAMSTDGAGGLSRAASDVGDRLDQIRHDVIRGLFEITLQLGSAVKLIGDPAARTRVSQVIGKTDDLIREVRLAILDEPPGRD